MTRSRKHQHWENGPTRKERKRPKVDLTLGVATIAMLDRMCQVRDKLRSHLVESLITSEFTRTATPEDLDFVEASVPEQEEKS